MDSLPSFVWDIWIRNAPKKNLDEEDHRPHRLRAVSVRHERAGTSSARKAPNGHPDFIQVVSKSDGKDYPQYSSFPLAEFQINGTKTPVTYSETVLDEHAVNVVGKYGDRVVNKGVRRVAPDGKTMRIDVTAIDQNGKEAPFFLVFNKVS